MEQKIVKKNKEKDAFISKIKWSLYEWSGIKVLQWLLLLLYGVLHSCVI